MNGFDEEKYQQLLENVAPTTSDNQLQHAIYRVKRDRKRKRTKVQMILAAALLLFTFVGLVRYSSTVAYAVAKLPGMKPLVEMIAHDKGLEDIVNNEYYEELNASQTIDDITLTITGVVADESGMMIYYKLKGQEEFYMEDIRPVIEVLQDGQGIENAGVAYSWYGMPEDAFEVENSIHVVSNEQMDYSNRDYELHFLLNRESDVKFIIPFTLQKEIKPSKRIVLNEELTVEQQEFTVHELVLSPIRSKLKLSINQSNSMKILDFVDIKVYDEKGEEWGRSSGIISGMGLLEDGMYSVMLESNYFRTPGALTIVFEKIEAIPEKDTWVTVDWDKKEIVHQPDILQIEMELKEGYRIDYRLRNDQGTEIPIIFGEMVDANGSQFTSSSMFYSMDERGYQYGQTYEVTTPLVNPVKLKVNRYPNYLKEKPRIEIKVE